MTHLKRGFMNRIDRILVVLGLVCLSVLLVAPAARANEVWVAPTLQADTGGLGTGNGLWPVTPQGVVRLVLPVPNDLQTFDSAKVALIPGVAVPAGVLHFYVCTAQNASLVGASCAGPLDQAFTGLANQLVEVNIAPA